MNEELIARLTPVFRKVFRNSKLTLNQDTLQKDIPGWDSLTHLQLMCAIESEFKIRFSMKQIIESKSLDLIIRAIQRCEGR